MINHNFNAVDISDGTSMDLYVAVPEGNGPFPGIILIQEAFGVNHHIRDVAERFCKQGYAVVSPDLYHRTAKMLDAPYNDFPSILPHYQALNNEGLTADLTASYKFLTDQANVPGDKTASIGYCLGGKVSFLANAVLPLTCAVSYYGGGLDTMVEFAEKLHGDHLFFWGGLDKHITEEKRQIIIDAVSKSGKDFTNVLFSYADHAFFCDERGSYHAKAAAEAWSLTLAFFENRLKPV